MDSSNLSQSAGAWWQLVFQRWAALRGLSVGGPLLVASAVVALLVAFQRLPLAAVAISTGVTGAWYVITIPWAMFDVWRAERIARIALESKPKAPQIRALVPRFESFDWNALQHSEYITLSSSNVEPVGLARFNALIELTNSGIPGRARNWRFTTKRQDGTTLNLVLSTVGWSRPDSWRNVTYWTLDQIENEFLKPETTYQVFVPLISSGWTTIGPDLPHLLKNFKLSFDDDTGAEIEVSV